MVSCFFLVVLLHVIFVFDMQLQLHEFNKWSVYGFALAKWSFHINKWSHNTQWLGPVIVCRCGFKGVSSLECCWFGGQLQLHSQSIWGKRVYVRAKCTSIRCTCTWIHTNIDSDDGNGENIQLIISSMRLFLTMFVKSFRDMCVMWSKPKCFDLYLMIPPQFLLVRARTQLFRFPFYPYIGIRWLF